MAKRIVICANNDCECTQDADFCEDGEPCPNCGEGVLQEVVIITRLDIEGRAPEYIAGLINDAFDN